VVYFSGMISKQNKAESLSKQITSAFGILNDCLRADDLEDYPGVIGFDHSQIKNKIALTTAAQLAGNRDKHISEIQVSCNCKTTTCKDGRCKCFKANVSCSFHCHAGSQASLCCNKLDKIL
jgi:hypothetical protein